MKVTLLEGDQVTTIVALFVVEEGDVGSVRLLEEYVLGIFIHWFNAITNFTWINEVPVVFYDVYVKFA